MLVTKINDTCPVQSPILVLKVFSKKFQGLLRTPVRAKKMQGSEHHTPLQNCLFMACVLLIPFGYEMLAPAWTRVALHLDYRNDLKVQNIPWPDLPWAALVQAVCLPFILCSLPSVWALSTRKHGVSFPRLPQHYCSIIHSSVSSDPFHVGKFLSVFWRAAPGTGSYRGGRASSLRVAPILKRGSQVSGRVISGQEEYHFLLSLYLEAEEVG